MKDAVPPESVPAPIAVDPFLKVTFPVGVGPAEVTFTAKVTACGYLEGLRLELRVTVVALSFTTCSIALEVLVWRVLSPAYVAVMECVPAVKALVERVATPPAVVPVPIEVEPL